MADGFCLIGFDRRYRYVNPAAAAQVGLRVEDLVGRTIMEVSLASNDTAMLGAVTRCLAERRADVAERVLGFADGSTAWFHLSIAPAPEGVSVLSVDITLRKRAEDVLRAAEARHRALLHGLPDLVYLADEAGVCVDFSAPDPALLPVSPDRVVGRAIRDLLPPPVARAAQSAIEQALAGRGTQSFEYTLPLAAGSRSFEAVVVPADDHRVAVVARDVTDKRALETQLRQAQKMEAVGQLTGGIAHDLNNVLTVIGTNAELVASDLPPDAPSQQDLAELTAAVRHGSDMIGQLLRFSRRGTLALRPIDVAAAVRNLGVMLRRLLPESVRFEFGDTGEAGMILADPGALEQAVVNLCTNARDAMPRGGTIRIACEATFLDVGYHATHPWVAPGSYVCLSVADTGTGMDEATRERVFEPFFTTKPAGAGSGLGMAMVYGLMKQHGGMAHVYSEPGRGTVVKLYFPAAAPGVVAESRGRGGPQLVRGGTETVLLVEDEDSIRRASRRALEQKGYAILDAADGEQALALYREHKDRVALVITDLIMPRLGGRQLVEALRAEGSTVPVLFTSGYSEADVTRMTDLPTGVAFLEKPWTLVDLFVHVRDLLDGWVVEAPLASDLPTP